MHPIDDLLSFLGKSSMSLLGMSTQDNLRRHIQKMWNLHQPGSQGMNRAPPSVPGHKHSSIDKTTVFAAMVMNTSDTGQGSDSEQKPNYLQKVNRRTDPVAIKCYKNV